MPDDGMQTLDQVNRQTQAGKLLQIADKAEYWRTPQGRAYVTLDVRGHRESHAVEDPAFRDFLVHAYYREHGHGPNGTALRNVLTLLTARATQAGEEHEAPLRIAAQGGDIYLDLGDADWHAVHITPQGWDIIDQVPVRFTRAQGTKPLPVPARNGDIGDLLSMVNVAPEDMPLLTGWLLGALSPQGPYPILLLQGPPGSAKSTLARLVKSLVDPNDLELRSPPKELRDLQIAAMHSRCIALDNLSHVSQELGDTLCRLATGEATSSRTLYTNTGETVVKVQLPVILTGIGAIAAQADLLDRAIVLGLHAIPETKRTPESRYWRAWASRRASALGALLDAVSHGLATQETVHLTHLPRMADFAHWNVACEETMWQPGTFLTAYTRNRGDARQITMDADPVGQAVLQLMQDRTQWSGTASDLLSALELHVPENVREQQSWPKAPHVLSRRLSRIESVLLAVGVSVDTSRDGHTWTRQLLLTKTETADAADAADATFGMTDTYADAADTADANFLDQTSDGVPTLPTLPENSVGAKRRHPNALPEQGSSSADAADANLLPLTRGRGSATKEIELREASEASEASASVGDASNASDAILPDENTHPLYALIGQTVYTAQGAAALVQVFGNRVAVEYPGRGKVTYLSPSQVWTDELLS